MENTEEVIVEDVPEQPDLEIGIDGTRGEVVYMYSVWLVRRLLEKDPYVSGLIKLYTPAMKADLTKLPKAWMAEAIEKIQHELYKDEHYEDNLHSLKREYIKQTIHYTPNEDGTTHINCWSRGRTSLGRDLSNFANIGFDHPDYGYFSSVEGFWYWLSTGKSYSELRQLSGYAAKKRGIEIRTEVEKHGPLPVVEDFEATIKKALLCKVEQHPHLQQALKDCDLPLTHYYVFGKIPEIKVVYPDNYAWIHEYYELIREWLHGRAYKLIVAGSRTIEDYRLVREAYFKSNYKAIEIVSGRARGPDRLGERLAHELKLPIAKFPADWDKHPRVAGFIRNGEMAVYGDAGLLIWDGESGGTLDMEKNLRKLDKPYTKILAASLEEYEKNPVSVSEF